MTELNYQSQNKQIKNLIMVEKNNALNDCTEVLEKIREELEILEGIYCDEDVIESQAEVISVPKHTLDKVVEKVKQQEPNIAAQILQE